MNVSTKNDWTPSAVTVKSALPVKAGRMHFPALDGLRGIAILLVLIRHSLQEYELGPFQNWRSLVYNVICSTGWGVVLFFVLSGFLITGILLDSKQSPHYYRSFFGRRIVRIFPLYYGTIAAFWLMARFHGFYGDQLFFHRLPWLLTYTSNVLITLRRDWSFIFGRNSLGHFWSLAVEEQFYLFWPTVVLWSSTRTLRRICLAAVPLAFAVRVLLLHGMKDPLGAIVFLPSQVDALALGAYVAILVREQEEFAARIAWDLVSIGGLIWAVSCFDGNLVLTSGISGFAVLSAGLLVVCLYRRPAAWISNPVLRAYGKYSYGIYVLHVILLPYIVFLKGPLGRVGYTLFVMMVSFVAAWLSWHLYEVHFLRLKRFFPSDSSKAWHPQLSWPPVDPVVVPTNTIPNEPAGI